MRKREYIVDLSDFRTLRTALDALRSYLYSVGKGVVRIEVMGKRERRSDRQNRFYWPCFVQPFADYLRAQADGPVAEEDADREAHGILKARYLAHTRYINGQPVRFVGSTTALSTQEFNDYLDRCAEFLTGFGITIPPPSDYHEKVDRDARVKAMRAA